MERSSAYNPGVVSGYQREQGRRSSSYRAPSTELALPQSGSAMSLVNDQEIGPRNDREHRHQLRFRFEPIKGEAMVFLVDPAGF